MQIRNETPTSFEIRYREWEYLDGDHILEDISFMVVERGVTTLPSGIEIEAGSVSADRNFSIERFDANFDARPAFAATMASQTGPNAATPKLRNVNATGFQHSTDIQEAGPNSWPAEEMNWIAWEAGSSTAQDTFTWESVTAVTDDEWTTISFANTYSDACVFGEVFTVYSDPATIRHQNRTGSSIEVRIAEERSNDFDLNHGDESIAMLVAECEQGPAVDSIAPTFPSSPTLTQESVTSRAVRLSWPAASDPKLEEYRAYVDGVFRQAFDSITTSGVVLDLPSGTTQIVTIQAVDASGNETNNGPSLSVTTAPTPADTDIEGLPYGAFLHHTNLDETMPLFSTGHLLLNPQDAIADLEQARATGTQLFFASSVKTFFQNPDGTFNFTLWRERVDLIADIDLEPYIADGTIIGHYLIDEPKSSGSWGGQAVSNGLLDQMAAYSKSIWPTVPTVVREHPTNLTGFSWQHLDISWVQYNYRLGSDIDLYIERERAAAEEGGFGVVLGLQSLAGGDATSGIRPEAPLNPNFHLMSREEVVYYGERMIRAGFGCAMVNFRWQRDAETYFDNNSELRQGYLQLQQIAETYVGPGCDLRD